AETKYSAQACLSEQPVGLDHLAEPVFRTPVAAIRIGMVAFHQFLIACLDVSASRLYVKSKRFQRLGLKRPGLALMPNPALLRAEQVEGIARAAEIAGAA